MKITGLDGLINFYDFLQKKKIRYATFCDRDDCVTILVCIMRHRIEVDIFEDHIEYSIFSGNEGVEDDQQALFDLIARYKD